MTRVLVCYSRDKPFELGLVMLLAATGIDSVLWGESTAVDRVHCDAIVMSDEDAIRLGPKRHAGVLPRYFTAGQVAAWILATAAGGAVPIPSDVVFSLATRLEEPPADLEPEQERFLSLATCHTIEEVGLQTGYSRRQAQRRFKRICEKYGFANHLDAAVTSGRWGLGQPAPPS